MEKISLKISRNFYEKQTWSSDQLVCGIDEAGRGPLAGPIVAAAAILHPKAKHPLLKDSKLLSQEQLQEAYTWLQKHCAYSISILDHKIIDRHNIYQATLLAMRRSINQLFAILRKEPALILVDAMPLTLNSTIPIISAPFGETWSCSIAAASIIAKVTRDNIMRRLDTVFNQYKFKAHKGYATPAHYTALNVHGASLIHRQTFLRKWNTAQGSIYNDSKLQTELFTDSVV